MTEPKKFTLIKQGAEAKLYKCFYLGQPTLLKERFVKKYRHPDLDAAISKERLKNEVRAIAKCLEVNIRTPRLHIIKFEKRQLYMEYFRNSVTVKDFIKNHVTHEPDDKNLALIVKLIGETVRKMHDNQIIHGDLTTSNMLIAATKEKELAEDFIQTGDFEFVMIDFGLSYVELRAEDKGVDLYVLERALLSTHNDHPDLFNKILDVYKGYSKLNTNEIINKFEEVRARGRKRTMIG